MITLIYKLPSGAIQTDNFLTDNAIERRLKWLASRRIDSIGFASHEHNALDKYVSALVRGDQTRQLMIMRQGNIRAESYECPGDCEDERGPHHLYYWTMQGL